jgi:hypothetical protein
VVFLERQVVKKLAVAGAVGAFAFLVSGPLQHVGVLPKTVIGDASKSVIKQVLDAGTTEAWACGRGPRGNNGWGNGGGDGVPGRSGFSDGRR